MLPGELSAKAVAMGFWHREVEQELQEIGLRDKWAFCKSKQISNYSGSYDNATEFIDSQRCENLYSHECPANCKRKGTLPM